MVTSRKKTNVAPVFKKEYPGNYRPVGLISVSGNMMEQLILESSFQTLDGQEGDLE